MSPEKGINSYSKTCKTIITKVWRETQFTCNHKVFIHFKIDKCNPTVWICPWCNSSRPTLLHRFWSCQEIPVFWDHMVTFIFGGKVLIFPKIQYCVYLDVLIRTRPTLLTISNRKNLCLLTASRIIPKFWTASTTPSIYAVKKELKDVSWKTWHESTKPWTHQSFFVRWKSFMEHKYLNSELIYLIAPFQYIAWYVRANLTDSLGRLNIHFWNLL